MDERHINIIAGLTKIEMALDDIIPASGFTNGILSSSQIVEKIKAVVNDIETVGDGEVIAELHNIKKGAKLHSRVPVQGFKIDTVTSSDFDDVYTSFKSSVSDESPYYLNINHSDIFSLKLYISSMKLKLMRQYCESAGDALHAGLMEQNDFVIVQMATYANGIPNLKGTVRKVKVTSSDDMMYFIEVFLNEGSRLTTGERTEYYALDINDTIFDKINIPEKVLADYYVFWSNTCALHILCVLIGSGDD